MCMWVQIFKHFEIMESWKSHWISKLIKEFSFMRSISSFVLLCIFLQVFSSYFCSFFHGAVRFCFSHIHSLFCLNMVFFHPLTHSLLSAESLDSFTSYILLLFDVNELYGSWECSSTNDKMYVHISMQCTHNTVLCPAYATNMSRLYDNAFILKNVERLS